MAEKMRHTIKTKNGNYILDDKIEDEVRDMINNGLDYTYIDGKKVSVYSDLRNSEGRITVIEVQTDNTENKK